ncbi:hypothetical protein [Legionella beliardensis]|uniref:hypothetical protein n=1 Tax=Legionella beliardensis TaxID=91822 RepID=UPI001041134D|nr:hypothetical protein [Legionella beliardensis]
MYRLLIGLGHQVNLRKETPTTQPNVPHSSSPPPTHYFSFFKSSFGNQTQTSLTLTASASPRVC